MEALIEFDPPVGAFLSFPCWAWHEVFCGQYLALTGAEKREWDRQVRKAVGRRAWEAGEPPPPDLRAEVEASWLRLFDPDLPGRTRHQTFRNWTEREAVVEVIRAEWVANVREFVGVHKWYF